MLKALGSGLVGAFALTLVHETTRRFVEDAPRMDVVGMRAIAKTLRAVDVEPPVPLHETAMVGELVSNSLFYGLVGFGDPEDGLRNGAALGLAAGSRPSTSRSPWASAASPPRTRPRRTSSPSPSTSSAASPPAPHTRRFPTRRKPDREGGRR